MSDLSNLRKSEHLVQFFAGDEFLCSSVARFVASGLANNEGVIIVATKEHCEAISVYLGNFINASRAVASGQLKIYNAHECLTKFMQAGLPDPKLFKETMEREIEVMSASFPAVRAYGEMVNILFGEGNLEGTVALEHLWNELLTRYSFSLLCGYNMDNFKHDGAQVAFRRVCGVHSHVLPSEKHENFPKTPSYNRLIAELQQRTMALQHEVAERRSIERMLLEAKLAAESAGQAKSQFLANVSHEIRTPLGSIMGFTELLEENLASEEELAQYRAAIIRNARYLARIIDDVLDLAVRSSETSSLAELKLHGKRILMVDENSDNQLYVTKLLSLCGARADVASTGREGLAMAKIGEYDAILIDPTLDGLTVVRELRVCGTRTPVVTMSDHQLEGFDAFIEKPLDRAKLTRTLGALI